MVRSELSCVAWTLHPHISIMAKALDERATVRISLLPLITLYMVDIFYKFVSLFLTIMYRTCVSYCALFGQLSGGPKPGDIWQILSAF